MTVEAYLRAQVPGYPFDTEVLENAALSPIFAKPEALRPISIDDEILDHAGEEDWAKALKYATSTLFYSAAGMFSGGSRSEQVGDVHASQSGFIITQADREYYRSMGNKLREEIGYEPEESVQDTGGMRDGAEFRTACRPKRWN